MPFASQVTRILIILKLRRVSGAKGGISAAAYPFETHIIVGFMRFLCYVYVQVLLLWYIAGRPTGYLQP